MYIVTQKRKRLKNTLKEINKKRYNNIHMAAFEANKNSKYWQEALMKDPLNDALIVEECKAIRISMTTQKAYYEFVLQKTK